MDVMVRSSTYAAATVLTKAMIATKISLAITATNWDTDRRIAESARPIYKNPPMSRIPSNGPLPIIRTRLVLIVKRKDT